MSLTQAGGSRSHQHRGEVMPRPLNGHFGCLALVCAVCPVGSDCRETSPLKLYLHTSTDWVPLSAIGDASSKLDRVMHVCMRIGVNACQVAEGSIVRAG